MDIHPRISERHPELDASDVEFAWEHYISAATREVGARELRVGFDTQGRVIEMVGALTSTGWVVYHAMTPPSKKTLIEIANAGGGARWNTNW